MYADDTTIYFNLEDFQLSIGNRKLTKNYGNYIAHSEPLLKELNLLSVKDLMDLKLMKFCINCMITNYRYTSMNICHT